MADESYTIKEFIYQGFLNMDKRFNEMGSHLKGIQDRQDVANGRTNKLEKKVDTNITRFYTITTMLTLLGGVIIGLSVYAINSKIHAEVQNQISAEAIQYGNK